MKRLARWLFVGLTLAVAAGLLGWVGVTAWRETRPAPERLQGQVEATQATVSAKVAARIQQLDVRDGERVARGQVVGRLVSPELDARLAQAAAATLAARAQEDKAMTGSRQEEIRQAEAMWQRARAASALAEQTFGRIDRLYRDGVVPAQRRDEAEASMKASLQAEAAARAVYDLASAGARGEDKQFARAGVERARAATQELRAFEAELTLVAPISGEVVRRLAEPGELVGAGAPILTLVDLDDAWVVFQLREDRLNGVRPGHRFHARMPALGDQEVELEVSYVAAQADFATARPTNLQGGFDVKTFEVRARPRPPLPLLRPGMSAIVDGPVLVPAAAARP